MRSPDRFYSFMPYRCLLLLLVLTACGEDFRKARRLKAGSELARHYCGSCHAFPGPALLDKTIWEKDVLPVMGERLGIKRYLGSYYRQPQLSDTPGKVNSRITMEEWDQIVEYYTTLAPWRPLPQERPVPISRKAPPLFTIREPVWQNGPAPLTSFAGIDTLRHRLWIADAQDSVLRIYNNQLERLQQVRMPGIVSDIYIPAAGHTGYLTNIGAIYPSDALGGSVHAFQLQDSLVLQSLVKDHLPRPVQTLPLDLSRDNIPQSLLVCGFGFNNGYLAWLEPDSAVQPHVLLPFPGAIKAYIRDENRDGRPDIWVLFAQGDESIWYLENAGNGQFVPERVLQFPPAYGSSSFTLQDLDHDGREDIIYTCGDNADNSRILKPYHGVYIYRNRGGRRFAQQYFYPVNGCYKAVAKDMDLDGDEDLLTISFFADYDNQPQEALLYFENTGGLNFNVYTLPGSTQGHWICMDAGDVDGDGDTDVVLGNFSQGPANYPGLGSRWRQGPPFLLLENNTRQVKKKK